MIAPLDENSLEEAVAEVSESGAKSCAVCLLFSFLDKKHERRVGDALRKAEGRPDDLAVVRGAAGVSRSTSGSRRRCSTRICSR